MSSERASSMIFKSEKSASELSQRLIEVLDEEEDLRKSVQADTDHPFIKQNFFKEIFEGNQTGAMLKIHGAQLEKKSSNNEDENSDSDEEAFMQQQRISTKVVAQINKLHPYMMNDSSSRKGSSIRGSGSSYTSSIEERKSNGQYFQFPEKRKKRNPKLIEEIETKVVSTCTEEDEEDSEETFWRKKDEIKSPPVIYDKNTYMRFSEFSMLHYSKE